MVPLSAVHEQRTRRREAEKQSNQLRQKLAELEGKLSIIDRLNLPQRAAKSGPPTVEEDIFGAVKHNTDVVAELKKQLDERAVVDKQLREQQALVHAYRTDAAQFETKTPDFQVAYNYLLQSRA